MRSQLCLLLCASIAANAVILRQTRRSNSTIFTLPTTKNDIGPRGFALAEKRAGWTYGPSIAGDTAFYPAGSLGEPAAKAVADRFSVFQDGVAKNVLANSQVAGAAIVAVGESY